jgi:hypothetical protein
MGVQDCARAMRQSSKEVIRKTANAKHILILTATANRQLSIFFAFHSVRVFRWGRDYGTDQHEERGELPAMPRFDLHNLLASIVAFLLSEMAVLEERYR